MPRSVYMAELLGLDFRSTAASTEISTKNVGQLVLKHGGLNLAS